MAKYAKVLVERTARIFNKTFDYLIPENLEAQIKTGFKVLVPFGNRKISGYVLETTDQASFPRIKPLLAALSAEPLFDEEILTLTRWLSDYYFCYLISALKTALIFEETFEIKRKLEKEPPSFKFKLNTKTSSIYKKAIREIIKKIQFNQNEKLLLAAEKRLPFYLSLVVTVLRRNQTALMILPEEYQSGAVFETFKKQFPSQTALFKSTLGKNAKRKILENIKNRQIKILIGTRSAIFAPLPDLGLIIVDQEENAAFKQGKNPRYHALKVAEKRAEINGALLVAGTICPAVETYHRCQIGNFKLIELPYKNKTKINPVDLNIKEPKIKVKRKTYTWLLPLSLQLEIAHARSKKKPVLVFINRLGFFSSVYCKNCARPFVCPECGQLLAYNTIEKNFLCHHCLKKFENLSCNYCLESSFSLRGTGTERVQTILKHLFPASEIIRVDRLSAPGSATKLLVEAKKHHEAIYVTTKLGLKLGLPLHFEIIGFLGFDSLLNLPDFRAAEKLLQLTRQFFSEYFHPPKKIIIPTHHPKNTLFSALAGNYHDFYEAELKTRKELNYPPFCSLVILTVEGKNQEEINRLSENLALALPDSEILPLAEVKSFSKKKNSNRFLLKITDWDSKRGKLADYLNNIQGSIKFNLNVDPVEIL